MIKRNDCIYASIPSERYTPFSLAKKIGARVVLESARFNRGKERYSILMVEEAFHIIQDDEGIAFIIDGRRVPFINQAADIPRKTNSRLKIFLCLPPVWAILVMNFVQDAILLRFHLK